MARKSDELRKRAQAKRDAVLKGRADVGPRSLWWTEPAGELAVSESLIRTARAIRNQQKGRDASIVEWGTYYQGASFARNNAYFPQSVLAAASGPGSVVRRPPRYSLTYSITETLANRITKSDPKVQFLTDGGDYDLQEKAKLLSEFAEGLVYQTNGYTKAQEIFRDACWCGSGIGKVWVDESDTIQFDRVFPGNVWVDALDGKDKNPRTIYEISVVDMDVLCAKFPEREEDIRRAGDADGVNTSGDAYYYRNLAWCFEAYHLPSGPNAEDGRHVICLQNSKPLVDEPYEQSEFPYAVLRFTPNVAGMWGMGVPELLGGHQRQLDRCLEMEAQSYNLVSMPRVWIDLDSGVNIQDVQTNRAGTIGFYRGSPPQFMTPEAMSPGSREYRASIISDAYNYLGVSQLSATSQKPQGLDSSVALETMTDIEADRFSLMSVGYDRLFLEVTRKMVNAARETYKRGGFKVKTAGKKFLKSIDWKDVALDEDEYTLKMWPTALLPKTPSGQLETAQQLVQAGFITQDEARSLMNFPDLQGVLNMYEAVQQDAEATLSKILKDGENDGLDPLSDPQVVFKVLHAGYLRAKWQNVPADRLAIIETLLEQVQAKLAPAQQSGPPGPPSGAPTGVPMAPPQSALIPNAPQTAGAPPNG